MYTTSSEISPYIWPASVEKAGSLLAAGKSREHGCWILAPDRRSKQGSAKHEQRRARRERQREEPTNTGRQADGSVSSARHPFDEMCHCLSTEEQHGQLDPPAAIRLSKRVLRVLRRSPEFGSLDLPLFCQKKWLSAGDAFPAQPSACSSKTQSRHKQTPFASLQPAHLISMLIPCLHNSLSSRVSWLRLYLLVPQLCNTCPVTSSVLHTLQSS